MYPFCGFAGGETADFFNTKHSQKVLYNQNLLQAIIKFALLIIKTV